MNVRVKFTKTGALRFMGQLDILRYFQKANRRAGIDAKYSAGYNPHQIMSFSAPLGLGSTSEGEYMDIEVNTTGSSAEMVRRLNGAMAEGIQVLSWRRLPDQSKSAMAVTAAADYLLYFREGYEPEDQEAWIQSFREFYEQPVIRVIKQTKKKTEEVDIRPMIHKLEISIENLAFNPNLVNLSEGEQIALRMELAAGSADNLKPDLVMEAFCQFLGQEYLPLAVQIHRTELYAREEAKGDALGRLISLEDMGEEIE